MLLFKNPISDESKATDLLCCWDGTSTDLGMGDGSTPPEPPAPAEPAADAPADAPAEGVDPPAEVADVDDDDPLSPLLPDDEPDEPADPRAARSPEDRIKALSKRNRKLERAYKKHLPTVQALREAGLDVKSLMQRSQTLANMERAIETNPRLRALFNGDPEPDATRGRGEPPADEIKFPFDTNDEVGKWMSEFVSKSNSTLRETQAELRQALARVEKIERGEHGRQVETLQQTWHGAAKTAADKLDPSVRGIFMRAVGADFERVVRGELKNVTPQQVIDHYLKGLNVSAKQKVVASEAAKDRIARKNDTLPKRPAGVGSPASPRSGPRKRLEDFNRDMQRRFGAA